MNRGDRYRSVRWIAGLVSLAIFAAALLPEWLGVGASGLGGMQVAMLGVGSAILLVGLLLGRLSGRYLIAVVMTMFALSGIAGLVTLGDADVGWMLWRLRGKVVPRPALAIHEVDHELGWKNRPLAQGIDRHYDYQATYRIDGNGFRENGSGAAASPAPKQILCLGCSFTFGQGVEDSETYPAQWEKVEQGSKRVVNAGVNGWGTVQAMLLLQRVLQGENRPQMVTYGILPIHANRNSDRKTWLEILSLSEREKPVLKEENGRLVFDRLIGASEGREPSSELAKEEVRITLKCIEQMNSACQSLQIPFYCVVLGADRMPDTAEGIDPQSIMEFCRQQSIPFVDCSDLPADRFPHDGHPTAAWHRQVGQRMAERTRVEAPVD